jgi:hypothetical protein
MSANIGDTNVNTPPCARAIVRGRGRVSIALTGVPLAGSLSYVLALTNRVGITGGTTPGVV